MDKFHEAEKHVHVVLKHCGMRMEDGAYVHTPPIYPHVISTRASMSVSTVGIDRIDIVINCSQFK